MKHSIIAKNLKEIVLLQEAEDLDELGLQDNRAEQEYKHLTGHHIIHYGAVGEPLGNMYD